MKTPEMSFCFPFLFPESRFKKNEVSPFFLYPHQDKNRTDFKKDMKKLTERQQKYITAFEDCEDHTEACRRAGYKNPEVAGRANKNNIFLQEKIKHGMNDPIRPDTTKKKKHLGRPRIEIDMEEMKKLCSLHCTKAEVAGWFHVSDDTIERRCIEDGFPTWTEFFERHSAGGKISLRRKQFQVAIDGNVSMLIWLGKQFLGQVDGRHIDITKEKDTKDDWLKKLSDDDLTVIEDILKKYENETKPESD